MMDQPHLLVLRADADARIGTGHVMRCLALAQYWQNQGGEAAFVGHIDSALLRQRLLSEGFQIYNLPAAHPNPLDLTAFLPWLHEHHFQAGWVALDGYHFDPVYQQAVRAAGWPLVVVDDYGHLSEYHADIIVNQNAYAKEIDYQAQAQALILRGVRFALLRKEFRQALTSKDDSERCNHGLPGRRILITMGGADPDNVAGKVLDTLQSMAKSGLEVKVVIGPLNPHRQALQERLNCLALDTELLTSVTDMVSLMRWADLAISAAGSTCWELAALGVPMVVTVLADNQERVAASLAEHGVAVNLGWFDAWQAEQVASVFLDLMDNAQKRLEMAQKGQQLIDGRGCERLTQAMLGYHFLLRLASEDDCETVFQWANDPLTRAVSFSWEAITWQEHFRWFTARLADQYHIFYIAITPSGLPMAQARFALRGDGEAVISVSLAPDFRGVGLGSRFIRLACQQAMTERHVTKIQALIRQDNISSLHVFAQAGFRQHGSFEISSQQSVTMDYTLASVAA